MRHAGCMASRCVLSASSIDASAAIGRPPVLPGFPTPPPPLPCDESSRPRGLSCLPEPTGWSIRLAATCLPFAFRELDRHRRSSTFPASPSSPQVMVSMIAQWNFALQIAEAWVENRKNAAKLLSVSFRWDWEFTVNAVCVPVVQDRKFLKLRKRRFHSRFSSYAGIPMYVHKRLDGRELLEDCCVLCTPGRVLPSSTSTHMHASYWGTNVCVVSANVKYRQCQQLMIHKMSVGVIHSQMVH